MDLATMINDLDEGVVSARIGGELAELVKACMETGKKGSLTLKMTLVPGDRICSVTVDTVVKTPKKPLNNSLFFVKESGELVRENPRQLPLPEPKVEKADRPESALRKVVRMSDLRTVPPAPEPRPVDVNEPAAAAPPAAEKPNNETNGGEG